VGIVGSDGSDVRETAHRRLPDLPGTPQVALRLPIQPQFRRGAYDLLIAGQALARELTLVTANVSEFSRVKGLAWQDWAKP